MLKRIENRLLGCSTLLSTGDKLTLIKSVFTSMPTFFMCTMMIPKTVIKQINSYLMNCFWRKYATQDRGAALISWEQVCKPKSHGGLGVLDLHTHNKTLLMKSLYKFFNRADIPWVNIIWESYYQHYLPNERMIGSFWLKAILKLLPTFRLLHNCKAGTGDTISFWTDNWQNTPLQTQYPELFSFAINKEITLGNVQQLEDLSQLFNRPLSLEAFNQFNVIEGIIMNKSSTADRDYWYTGGISTKFSSMKLYKVIMGPSTAHVIFKKLWNTACRLRHKIFFWLLLHDRISTRKPVVSFS